MAFEQKNPWQERWQLGRTGWDLGAPHPLTPEIWRKVLDLGLGKVPPHSLSVMIPGCGKAHDASFFQTCPEVAKIYGVDIVAEAVSEAKRLYGGLSKFSVQECDCLKEPLDSLKGTQNIVFDRAFLCALAPDERIAYLSFVKQVLIPGGFFVSIPFTDVNLPEGKISGPPFAIAHNELLKLCKNDFSLVWWRDHRVVSLDGVIGAEALMIWELR